MANQHRLGHQENTIKATERYLLTPNRVAFIKETGNTKCEGLTEKGTRHSRHSRWGKRSPQSPSPGPFAETPRFPEEQVGHSWS